MNTPVQSGINHISISALTSKSFTILVTSLMCIRMKKIVSCFESLHRAVNLCGCGAQHFTHGPMGRTLEHMEIQLSLTTEDERWCNRMLLSKVHQGSQYSHRVLLSKFAKRLVRKATGKLHLANSGSCGGVNRGETKVCIVVNIYQKQLCLLIGVYDCHLHPE